MKSKKLRRDKNTIRVHFVCTGNVYRSRLAEAYLRSKQLPNVEVSSSGIYAELNKHGPISWLSARLAKHHDLVPHLKPLWTQTTPELLNDADIVIFMTDKQYKHAQHSFHFQKTTYEIWGIMDLDDAGFKEGFIDNAYDLKRIEHSEKTLKQIKQKVDALAAKLKNR